MSLITTKLQVPLVRPRQPSTAAPRIAQDRVQLAAQRCRGSLRTARSHALLSPSVSCCAAANPGSSQQGQSRPASCRGQGLSPAGAGMGRCPGRKPALSRAGEESTGFSQSAALLPV